MTRSARREGSQRSLRVGEELRHALAHVLERGEVRDPRVAQVAWTVTEVRMSPDLRHATVFVAALGGVDAEAVRAMEHAKGFLRTRLAHLVHLRYVPDLSFKLDDSFDQADRIARVLRDPAVARDLESELDTNEHTDATNNADDEKERPNG